MSRFFNTLISSSESEGEDYSSSAISGNSQLQENEKAPLKKSKFMYSESEYSSEEDDDEYSDDDSEEDSSDEDGSDEDEEEENEANEESAPARRSRFLMVSDSEDDEEGVGRVVKSQKEKAWDEIISIISLINDSIFNDDWNGANINFDRLSKQATKTARLGLPPQFFTFLNALETEHMAEMSAAEVKKLDKENAKAFNALRQKSRKVISAHSEDIKRTLNPESASTANESAQDSTKQQQQLRQSENDKTETLTAESGPSKSSNAVIRKLQEVMSTRGKKNVDRNESLTTLRGLFTSTSSEEQKLQILNALISCEFDLASSASGYMPHVLWSSALADIKALGALLQNYKQPIDGEQELIGLPTMAGIRGSFVSYLYRIDDEFLKALQYIDPHSPEYVQFVKAESEICTVLMAGRVLLEAAGNVEAECQVLMRYLEHIYYQPGNTASAKEALDALLARGSDRLKQKALLCFIFHASICGDYRTARDLFQQHRFQDSAASLESGTQIIYNRAMVAMSLCAFRQGFIKDAYFGLHELCASGRPKELLAQGMQAQRHGVPEKTPEQERLERQRQLPSHMHLNVELIDCVFLTCSMILETPQTAFFCMKSACQQDRKMYQSRHLKRLIEAMERSAFSGPAENSREALVLAARKLACAEWEACLRSVLSVKAWEVGGMPLSGAVKEMIEARIKEAALCTFVYSFGPSFDALLLSYLAESFEMDIAAVSAVLSKVISETGLPAVIDEQSGCLKWTVNVQLSKLQEMSMVLADKIQIILDRNEETAEFMHRPMSSNKI